MQLNVPLLSTRCKQRDAWARNTSHCTLYMYIKELHVQLSLCFKYPILCPFQWQFFLVTYDKQYRPPVAWSFNISVCMIKQVKLFPKKLSFHTRVKLKIYNSSSFLSLQIYIACCQRSVSTPAVYYVRYIQHTMNLNNCL